MKNKKNRLIFFFYFLCCSVHFSVGYCYSQLETNRTVFEWRSTSACLANTLNHAIVLVTLCSSVSLSYFAFFYIHIFWNDIFRFSFCTMSSWSSFLFSISFSFVPQNSPSYSFMLKHCNGRCEFYPKRKHYHCHIQYNINTSTE